MLTKLLKICVRKWQAVEPDLSELPSPNPVSFPVYFNEVLEEQTGDSGSTGLWKGLGIRNFNTSSRWVLRSSKCRKCCFTSHGLLKLRCIWPLSCQLLLLHLGTFQGWEMGGDHIPTPTSSLVCGMFQWKQVLLPTPLEIQTFISRQTGTKNKHNLLLKVQWSLYSLSLAIWQAPCIKGSFWGISKGLLTSRPANPTDGSRDSPLWGKTMQLEHYPESVRRQCLQTHTLFMQR